MSAVLAIVIVVGTGYISTPLQMVTMQIEMRDIATCEKQKPAILKSLSQPARPDRTDVKYGLVTVSGACIFKG